MDFKAILHLVVTLAIFVKISHGQNAAYVCKHSNVNGSEFEIIFKYFRDGNTQVTSLISYDASLPPNNSIAVDTAACSTRSLDDDILTLQYTVDVNATLPCGIFQDSVAPSLYRIAVVADQTYFTFACNISDLQLPNDVTIDSFATGHLMNIGEFQIGNNADAKLELLTTDGQAAREVKVGDYVKLQFSYNINNTKIIQDALSSDTSDTSDDTPDIPDNLGKVFHMAYPITAQKFRYKIITLSENMNDVQVTFSFNGSVDRSVVQTSKATPYVGNYSFDYSPTANLTSWNIINFGLKIQTLGEEIGVILDIDDSAFVMALQPDDVLGKEHRFIAVSDYGNFHIVGTENNTEVTFDLSHFNQPSVEIAGVNFLAGFEATVVIHEHEAIEVMCVSCQLLSTKSNKRVSVLGGDVTVQIIPETKKQYREFILFQSVIITATKRPHSRTRDFYLVSGDISTNVNYTVENVTKSLPGTRVEIERITTDSGQYLRSTGPVLILQDSFHALTFTTANMVVPSIIQWSTQYYFNLEDGNYTFLVTSTEKDIDSITFITPSLTLSIDTAVLGGSVFTSELGVTYRSLTMDLVTGGWIEVNSNGTGAPFGVYTIRSELRVQPSPIIPFGMRFPCVNASGDIVSCNTSPTDETPEYPSELQKILMTDNLIVSDNRDFIGKNVIVLHRQGCNIGKAGSTTVSPFERETIVSGRRERETEPFKMFRFRGSPYLNIQLTFRYCLPGSCTASCTGRVKRSTESLHHVNLQIAVTDGVDDDINAGKTGKRQARCESTIIYWMPHMILLMIIIIEVVATSYFLMKKWKLKQS